MKVRAIADAQLGHNRPKQEQEISDILVAKNILNATLPATQ